MLSENRGKFFYRIERPHRNSTVQFDSRILPPKGRTTNDTGLRADSLFAAAGAGGGVFFDEFHAPGTGLCRAAGDVADGEGEGEQAEDENPDGERERGEIALD